LRMLGLNTAKGGDGMMGLSALPHTQDAARAAVDQAIAYGQAIDAHNVHVMAGFASGPVAHATFTDTLRYACDQAEQMTVLIEPLNRFDAPGYFLQSTDQAAQIIAELNLPNLKLMFDCYHVGRTEGDLVARLTTLMPIIGHIQFAGVPDRGTPLQGSVNYAEVFHHIADLGYSAPLGAEYHPNGATEDSLGWMAELRV
ncbi:MAG: hydroxypyruvate isomerase family protein, partial [Planktomarina sp.]